MMSITLINSVALFVLRLVKWVRLQLAKRVESLFSIRRLGRCKRCLGCDKRCDRNSTREFEANSLHSLHCTVMEPDEAPDDQSSVALCSRATTLDVTKRLLSNVGRCTSPSGRE